MFLLKSSRSIAYSPRIVNFLNRFSRSTIIGGGARKKLQFFSTISPRLPGSPNRIRVVETENEWNEILPFLIADLKRFPALGFDCEWAPESIPDWSLATTSAKLFEMEESLRKHRKKRNKVSLVQLATRDGTAIVIRLNRLLSIPESMKSMLAEADYLKVGVESTLDGRRLIKDFPNDFDRISGSFDVRYLLPPEELDNAKSEPFRYRNNVFYSLNDLCLRYLNVVQVKRIRITCSDWAADELSSEQIEYAAADAQISIDVFAAMLESIGFNIDDEKEWEKMYEYCRPYVDDVFKIKPTDSSTSTRRIKYWNSWKKGTKDSKETKETDISVSGIDKKGGNGLVR